MALDEDTPVAAHLGREQLAPLHRRNGERVGLTHHWNRGDDRDRSIALIQYQVAPILHRQAVDRFGLATSTLRKVRSPTSAVEEMGLHVHDEVGSAAHR